MGVAPQAQLVGVKVLDEGAPDLSPCDGRDGMDGGQET
ncbi:MAG: hypothetical protein Ct9H90mP24_5820 [Methanobacteriota archaeon]|nr:MAG: hypothetical protein Ct9H90mP24_5820 [Euryarchaeota archaeon]